MGSADQGEQPLRLRVDGTDDLSVHRNARSAHPLHQYTHGPIVRGSSSLSAPGLCLSNISDPGVEIDARCRYEKPGGPEGNHPAFSSDDLNVASASRPKRRVGEPT
ncbi:hypothetical protein GCM10009632_21500 [Mycolicibacterium alvei]|uniref:Uncharacterized protein n=1 Tax=Mycolicibacterium alvei TaxID=67081 RepID=A0A6N4UK03_9MYCO|nr:hypothetical protein MALV_02650 [Mycolicibacterium alvei]